MDKETVGVEDLKKSLAADRMEAVVSDDGVEKVITEKGKGEINAASEEREGMISEGLLLEGEDQPSDSVTTDILVEDASEEIMEVEQLVKVQSPGKDPNVDVIKNGGTSDDGNGELSESLTSVEARVTDTWEKKHEDDENDIVETREVRKDDHAKKDEGNELTEVLSINKDNLDVAVGSDEKSEAGNCINEVEHIDDNISLLSEKVEESLVSDKEISQPEIERGEAVKSENSTQNSEVELNAQAQVETENVFGGTEVLGMEDNKSGSSDNLNANLDNPVTISERTAAIKNFVKQKSSLAVSTFIQRLSRKADDNTIGEIENGKGPAEDTKVVAGEMNQNAVKGSVAESDTKDLSDKSTERSSWNPLTFLMMSRESESKPQAAMEGVEADPILPITMKGRIILYTRLGCQECKAARLYLHQKRLGYVELNIDVYPSRKSELEKLTGSSSVPKIFFNEVVMGGLSDLKSLEESGKLDENIERLIAEAPSIEAPLPPLSGEDDESNNGTVDENALFIRKMRESIVVRDRFSGLRRHTSCFLGSDAVNFISEDQYLEREEAIQFGRKLASQFFILHVLEENLFEDGNHLYRFLDQDPIVSSQCQNIPRGILDVKPKPITEIASRLRFLEYAMLEAYASDDGRHLDYRSIHGSEEFARYLRTIEELQRVDLQDMSREEKLAFYINLYNMMAIHAILIWGHPTGALERRRMTGDFKYVIGGCTYSLSAIENGILRANQRPPYNLVKPFGAKDKRLQLVLPHVEPLIHFALVCGTRSGPALRCYSPGNIDKELTESARNFVKSGGVVFDLNAKTSSVSSILKWFSADFGKNETEVLKHVVNYLDPPESEAMLELLGSNQLKVTYQTYDWGLNH